MKNKTPVIITAVVAVVLVVVAVVAIVINNNNNGGGQSSGNNSSQNNSNNTNNNTQNSSIVGVWKYDDASLADSFVYTFNADGTGNYTAAGNFTYKVDGNKISITYDSSGATFETEFEVSGDKLNIIDSLGEDTFYNRAE